ncbi:hypothetical protein FK521_30690, partial [Klebsiella pneumoniae]|nr:hypothetical protein [Klebsiella pneumoniae]
MIHVDHPTGISANAKPQIIATLRSLVERFGIPFELVSHEGLAARSTTWPPSCSGKWLRHEVNFS